MALNVICKYGNLCCLSFQNLTGVCVYETDWFDHEMCVHSQMKEHKIEAFENKCQENILTLDRDGTCTVHGAVRSAHKITKSVEQIPS